MSVNILEVLNTNIDYVLDEYEHDKLFSALLKVMQGKISNDVNYRKFRTSGLFHCVGKNLIYYYIIRGPQKQYRL